MKNKNTTMPKKYRKVSFDIMHGGNKVSNFTITCPTIMDIKLASNNLESDHQSSQLYEQIQKLTNQELQVARLIAFEKKSSKEIATHMNLKLSTIETYRSRIIEKLGIKTMQLKQYKDLLKE